jgi:hypothetical protein
MAKARGIKKVCLELDLEEEEAQYLKLLLQNYLGPGDEPITQQRIRQIVFIAIKEALG